LKGIGQVKGRKLLKSKLSNNENNLIIYDVVIASYTYNNNVGLHVILQNI